MLGWEFLGTPACKRDKLGLQQDLVSYWVTEKIKWTSSSWEYLGFKPTQTKNRISVHLHSSVRALRTHREKVFWLIRNFTTGVLEASPSRATSRESFDKELLWAQVESWLFEHAVTSDSPKAHYLWKNLLLRAENSLSALAMWTVTKNLTGVARESVPDFIGIASLSIFFLLIKSLFSPQAESAGKPV